MADGRTQRLAELAVLFGANVQPGQLVAMVAETGQEDVARVVADAAYRAGAKFVDVFYFDPHVKHSRLLHAPEETLEYLPPWYGERALHIGDERGARISFAGSTTEGLFADVDPKRAGKDLFPFTKESLKIRRTNDELDGRARADARVGEFGVPRPRARRRLRAPVGTGVARYAPRRG